jgi:hypothetical protein
MPKWNLSIRDATDRAVRGFLARTGLKKGDLSKFVEDAVRSEVLRRTVAQIQIQNADLDAAAAAELADEAVVWARARPS